MKEITFKTNINCSGCIAKVTPLLNEIKEIKSWEVNTADPAKILTVTGEGANDTTVINAVKKAGFSIEKVQAGE